ncbi:hypothetical protein PSTAB_1152 [Stutzerimonas stutzeri]|uniref:Uncharacterized protein n=1 Tax=Stutzerimonas stutzeri (strain ATCC 17588 / DSM 5190 / CCUG 11256 / JCM 5965 / LMG 11199 / NBRC 14165 / NCIMB 11358 / Stanier 221) TaxID=96563 RepID=F8H1U2_STUS2|nr:hypothetical protein PSTAB_1152 [Stutzerimonas stutzeri]
MANAAITGDRPKPGPSVAEERPPTVQFVVVCQLPGQPG